MSHRSKRMTNTCPNTLRRNSPKVLALDAELLKRFQPLRSRLTPKDKSRVTKFLKDLNFVQMIQFTSCDNTGDGIFGIGGTQWIFDIADKVLHLLLDVESTQVFDAVHQKYATKNAQREKNRVAAGK